LFEIGFSNHDSVSHRPISELKRLKFAQPADLPVQQAVMVANLKTAKVQIAANNGRVRFRSARFFCSAPHRIALNPKSISRDSNGLSDFALSVAFDNTSPMSALGH
jgi:hypothetical protein